MNEISLNTEQECEDYLFSEFPAAAARASLPYLKKLTPLLTKEIGNDYRIKGYKRKDAIGFCIIKKDNKIESPVRTNFVVLKPKTRIIDFFHLGYPNNFAVIKKFKEIDALSEDELNNQLGSSFSGRVSHNNLPVHW